MKTAFVYIITNKNNTVLYTGVTTDLKARINDHIPKKHPDSFSARYNVNKLVWFEEHLSITAAIAREKQIKAGSRDRKMELILSVNPDFEELNY